MKLPAVVKACILTVVNPLPPPAGVAQVASPLQKVVLEADVPLFRFVTGRFPVTPVVRGNPVHDDNVPLVGVPKAGVTNVGLVAPTNAPDPVDPVNAFPTLLILDIRESCSYEVSRYPGCVGHGAYNLNAIVLFC